MNKLLPDKFILIIASTIVIAYIFPQLGAPGGAIPLDKVTSAGIALIFFFYGLKLSPDKIKAGLKNWRLHILIQSGTFLIFPLLVLAVRPLMHTEEHQSLWLAVFFLSALPSTVSTSVVMVSIAKGNIPAAIFNASLSGVIGIIITPLWMSLFIHQQHSNASFIDIYLQLIFQIALPLTLGLLLQKKWGSWAVKNSKKINVFDKTIICLIVYKSFAASFIANVFADISWADIIILLIIVTVLFACVYGIIFLIAWLLDFSKEDRTAALFCGSKKSLVHGTVFSKVLFGNAANTGVLLLPLMMFHAMQILIVSAIAAGMERSYNKQAMNVIR